MSSANTHIIAGAILSILTVWFLSYQKVSWISIPIIAIIVYFYSQLPDIDHENSRITWTLLSISAAIILYGVAFKYYPEIFVFDTLLFGVVFLILTIVAAKMEHRGPTHTVWFIALASLVLLLIPGLPNKWFIVAIAFASAYSHLLMDGYLFKMGWQPKKGFW